MPCGKGPCPVVHLELTLWPCSRVCGFPHQGCPQPPLHFGPQVLAILTLTIFSVALAVPNLCWDQVLNFGCRIYDVTSMGCKQDTNSSANS